MHLSRRVNTTSARMLRLSLLTFSLCAMATHGLLNAQAMVDTPTLKGAVPIKTWKALRDDQIVKQDLDYSCGAASLATILNGFYEKGVTEEEILLAMNKEDGMASFADMARVLPNYGFKGVGVALGIDQLRRIKVPAVVYLRYRDDDHFSVLRGVSDTTVHLGDPSWGNRSFSIAQFLAMWETRGDANFKGKALLVLPEQSTGTPTSEAFFSTPNDQNLAIELLGLRSF